MVPPYYMVEPYQHFEETCSLNFQAEEHTKGGKNIQIREERTGAWGMIEPTSDPTMNTCQKEELRSTKGRWVTNKM
jgi:hypothetical protein